MNILDKDELRIKATHIILFFSLLVLIAMFYTVKPRLHGDGTEYLYITQSFVNHQTPDLRPIDIQYSQALLGANGYTNVGDPYVGFFTSHSGKVYSYHFWFYPFLCSIVQRVLKILNLNQFRAMQVTNALLFLIAIWYSFLKINFENNKKTIFFIMLIIVNPVLWYLVWTHPEVFSYSFVLISLTLYSNKKYKLSMLLSAIASMQNPPLLVLNIVYIVKYLKENFKKLNLKDLLLAMLSCIPIVIPSIFYYINYSTLNLIAKYNGASPKFITFRKIFDQIFDFNMGILPYMPIIVILLFTIIINNLLRRKVVNLGWPIALLAIIILSTQTKNWNSDASGLMRYNVWLVPCILYYVITQIDFRTKGVQALLISAFTIQLVLVYVCGGFSFNKSFLYFNSLSKYIIENAPSLYSPNIETFNERLNHTEANLNYALPIYYKVGDTTTKIWTNYNGIDYIKALYDINDTAYFDKKIRTLENNKSKSTYINLRKGVLVRKTPRPIPGEGYKSDITVKEYIFDMEVNSSKDLLVEVRNKSDIDWVNFDEYQISISYHWFDENNNIVNYDGIRTRLPEALLKNTATTLDMVVISPNKPGNYTLELDLIQESITWFSKKGNSRVRIPVTVTDKENK